MAKPPVGLRLITRDNESRTTVFEQRQRIAANRISPIPAATGGEPRIVPIKDSTESAYEHREKQRDLIPKAKSLSKEKKARYARMNRRDI